MLKQITQEYEKLKDLIKGDLMSQPVADHIAALAWMTASYLNDDCLQVPLASKVRGKKYFAFRQKPIEEKLSRAINASLYDFKALDNLPFFTKGILKDLPSSERARLLYTVAASFMATIDVLKAGDQKTPATYFEIFVGHLLSRELGVNPRSEIEVLQIEDADNGTLPTDYIFDLGKKKPKFHVPVKTSTREQAIQVFAHQRILEGVAGYGAFKGLLVAFAETKNDSKKLEVTEICLPMQWQLYQTRIAPMTRFYYFDVPDKYAALTEGDPPMAVKQFSEFFDEVTNLIQPG